MEKGPALSPNTNVETCNTDIEEDVAAVFENYKKQQLEPEKGYSPFSYTLKKKKRRKKLKKSLTTEASKSTSDETTVEPLPMEFLEELEDAESSRPPKKSKKKKKKRIVVTSAVLDDSYIPLEADSATNFSLVRLDKSETLSSASTALQFYNNQLYGKRIARVSADSVIKNLKKTQAKKALAKRLV